MTDAMLIRPRIRERLARDSAEILSQEQLVYSHAGSPAAKQPTPVAENAGQLQADRKRLRQLPLAGRTASLDLRDEFGLHRGKWSGRVDYAVPAAAGQSFISLVTFPAGGIVVWKWLVLGDCATDAQFPRHAKKESHVRPRAHGPDEPSDATIVNPQSWRTEAKVQESVIHIPIA